MPYAWPDRDFLWDSISADSPLAPDPLQVVAIAANALQVKSLVCRSKVDQDARADDTTAAASMTGNLRNLARSCASVPDHPRRDIMDLTCHARSEERRVGKECICREWR